MIVYSSPINDHGASHFKNCCSYQLGEIFRSAMRVTMAAANGMPRKAATLVATVEYDGEMLDSEWLMTLMKKMARGANSTICNIELIATRIAQYLVAVSDRFGL